MNIPIQKIRPYNSTHPKGFEHSDAYHRQGIEMVKKAIQNGSEILPIMVSHLPEDGVYQRMDGFKRYFAYKELGFEEVECCFGPRGGQNKMPWNRKKILFFARDRATEEKSSTFWIAKRWIQMGLNVDICPFSEIDKRDFTQYNFAFMAKNKLPIKTHKKITKQLRACLFMNDALGTPNNPDWNKRILEQAPLYSVAISPYRDVCEKFEEADCRRVAQVFQGFEEPWFEPLGKEKISNVCFVGNLYDDRSEIINHLRSKGIGVAHFYGTSRMFANTVYNDTKICLNMISRNTFSNRCVRVMASGGFLLSQYDSDLERAFGDCIVFWETKDELVEKVKYYLRHDTEREQIAEKARTKVQIYSWYWQALKIYQVLCGENVYDGAYRTEALCGQI